jgi:hypothetical protein
VPKYNLVFALYLVFDIFEWIQAQRRARVHQLRLEKGAEKAAEELQKCEDTPLCFTLRFWSSIASVYLFLHVL